MGIYSRIIHPAKDFFAGSGITNIEITKLEFFDKQKKLDFFCNITSVAHYGELDTVYDKIKKRFGDKFVVDFKVTLLDENIDDDAAIDIVERAIGRLKERNAISRAFLSLYRIYPRSVDGIFTVKIELQNDMALETLVSSKIDVHLEEILRNYGLKQGKVEFAIGDFSKEKSEIVSLKIEELKELEKNLSSGASVTPVPPKPKVSDNTKKAFFVKQSGEASSFQSKKIKGTPISIKAFYDDIMEQDSCIVQGEVFSIETRDITIKKGPTPRNAQLCLIKISDGTSALTAKTFLAANLKLDCEIGSIVKINGKKEIDQFANNSPILKMTNIETLPKEDEEVVDNAVDKMVELHTHTKMSEMCGVDTISDIIKRAVKYGHKAVALTDYGVVHSFPEAYKAAKSVKGVEDFKAILGCEVYMVDDIANIVRNPKDKNIEDETYVVFDIETCGFNAYDGVILEIGAVKLRGTKIVDRFSELINPHMEIPRKISTLTNITNEMVADKEDINVIFPKFMDFVGDATLVAHNANFDTGFIRRNAKKLLDMDYNPSIIDTLEMARILYPDFKKYGLGVLDKKLGLGLESHHRAMDDAAATARMFVIFMEKYLEKGITNIKDIDAAFPKNIKMQSYYNVVLLVQNSQGLKNLYEIVSRSHIDHHGDKRPKVPKSLIIEKREGLIIGGSLSGLDNNYSELFYYYTHFDPDRIDSAMDFYDYIELLPRAEYSENIEEDRTGDLGSTDDVLAMNRYMYDLAISKGKIVTASSNVHYIHENDAMIRSILLFGSGYNHNQRKNDTDSKLYFRTTEEMLAEFEYLGEDIAHEIVVTNTNKIADMIDKIQPIPSGFYPPKLENAEETVREMTYTRAYEIYGNPLPEIVEKRLERELKAIIGNGFAVLYLSAQKLVKKSIDDGYLVGSRGSVGSSLVAYMMGITEVNALYPHYICDNPQCKYSEFIEKEGIGHDLPEKNCPHCGEQLRRDGFTIPFEVFMGFDGDKTPDIDLNFSGDEQSNIHRYTESLFGKTNVFKAGTISTLAEKNAYGYVKKYFEEKQNVQYDSVYSWYAKKVEGAKKTTGQHPGGMVIVPADKSVYDFCPVQKPANDMETDSITTHFDYHVMDEQLVKLDILGHDDPTTLKMLEEYTGVNIKDIPLGDRETIKLFSSTESLGVQPNEIGAQLGTFGIPEFGTPFVMKNVLMETMPTTVSELVRIAGLSHGTDVWTNNAQDLVKAGKATLNEIITVRDDIMNYLIDMGLENLTAFKIMEFVRKGKAKAGEGGDPKLGEEWDKYKSLMRDKNVPEWYIESCGKIGYMFPKGHAAAYVMMSLRIAYFKVHYPLAFYAAYLSRKADVFNYEEMYHIDDVKAKMSALKKEPKMDVKQKAEEALCEILIEMHARKINFLPIDIYKSTAKKFVIEDDKIRVPLISIQGLGESVAQNIVSERDADDFMSVEDLKRRTKLTGTTVDKLKKLGVLNSLSEHNQMMLF